MYFIRCAITNGGLSFSVHGTQQHNRIILYVSFVVSGSLLSLASRVIPILTLVTDISDHFLFTDTPSLN